MKLQETLYQTIRAEFGLKSQFTISAFKTVTARYKTVQEQLFQNPYRYENEKGKHISSVGHWNGFKSQLCFVALRLIL